MHGHEPLLIRIEPGVLDVHRQAQGSCLLLHSDLWQRARQLDFNHRGTGQAAEFDPMNQSGSGRSLSHWRGLSRHQRLGSCRRPVKFGRTGVGTQGDAQLLAICCDLMRSRLPKRYQKADHLLVGKRDGINLAGNALRKNDRFDIRRQGGIRNVYGQTGRLL